MEKMTYARVSIAALLALLVLGACATSGASYRQPGTYNVETERMLDTPFADVWDMYVAKLSESFFVINNISKDSRLINVSFSVDRPSEFVDCGHATRTSSHPATGKQTFSYETADDAVFNVGIRGTNVLWTLRRNTNLEGRVNIYMAPNGNQTQLRVNVRYAWSNHVSGSSNVGGVVSEQYSMNFSSKEVATRTDSDVGVGGPTTWSCRSRGRLEYRLLHLI